MEVTTPGAARPSGTNGLATYQTIDPLLVIEHLAAVLEIALGATRRELESVGSLLSKSRYSDTVQRCTRFATENQTALYVQKEVVLPDGLDEQANGLRTLRSLFWLILTSKRPFDEYLQLDD